jgi:UDP-N-acetylglucosamine 4-epimerase
VQANLLAALTEESEAVNQVYNVAVNARTTLCELFELPRNGLVDKYLHLQTSKPVHRNFRAGDVLHSRADISKAGQLLEYEPTHTIRQGPEVAFGWYEATFRG